MQLQDEWWDSRVIREVAFLLSIPIALILIHAIVPRSLAEEFYFYPWSPETWTAWTAAIFHSSWEHVLGNSVAYGLAMFGIYSVFAAWDRRKFMWVVFGVLLLTTPAVTGLMNVVVLREYVGVVGPATNMKGFSGIVSALVGMLVAVLGVYGNERSGTSLGYSLYFGVFLLVAGVLAFLFGSSLGKLVQMGFLVLVGFGLIAYQVHRSFDGIEGAVRRLDFNSPVVLNVGVGIVIVVGMLLIMFPANPAAGDSMTNVVSHFAGLVYGFLLTLFMGEVSVRGPRGG